MKQLFKLIMGCMLMLAMPLMLTSCEGTLDDVFGEWSRPTGNNNNDNTETSVTGIELNKETLELAVGDADVTLTATVKPDDATDKTVTWSSDNEDAATVADGVVHAVAVGTAIITAKAGDKSATCEVTVTPGLSTPLTLEALSAGTIKVWVPKDGMQYSLNGGAKTVVTNAAINVAKGDKMEFYGTASSYGGTRLTDGTAQVKVYGNIMSLVDPDFATVTTPTLTAIETFSELFAYNNILKDASGLLLPATTLADHCYYQMFRDCLSLTTAPALPATDLTGTTHCYDAMFQGCTSLTTAPELKATTLALGCYEDMFNGCSNLTTAPELKVTTLADYCYLRMFKGCISLTTAPELKATTLTPYCYWGMFQGCTSLTTAPELKALTLTNYCYYQMFKDCSKLSSVTCLATNIAADYCTTEWLDGAGTDASVTSKTIYINSSYSAYISGMNNDLAGTADNAQINTNVPWKKGTSGIPAGWTIVDYVAP